MSTTKGRTVGCWLSGEALDALGQALTALKERGETAREGTWGAEAIEQRLTREGFLKKNRSADVAAQASELADVLGADVVEAKLAELALLVVEKRKPQPAGAAS